MTLTTAWALRFGAAIIRVFTSSPGPCAPEPSGSTITTTATSPYPLAVTNSRAKDGTSPCMHLINILSLRPLGSNSEKVGRASRVPGRISSGFFGFFLPFFDPGNHVVAARNITLDRLSCFLAVAVTQGRRARRSGRVVPCPPFPSLPIGRCAELAPSAPTCFPRSHAPLAYPQQP